MRSRLVGTAALRCSRIVDRRSPLHTLPLVLANLAAGAMLTFIFSMFEVSQSLVLVQDPQYWPISSALNRLGGRFADGPALACAMGVVGMIVLGSGLIVAGSFLGRRLGEIFRA